MSDNKGTKKKPTNTQLQKRIERAVIHIDRTKDTKEVYFTDKGLRIVVTDDFAVISTGFHDHVFTSYTMEGVSRPYLYAKRFVELAHENDCLVKGEDGEVFYSYKRLIDMLKERGENDADYLIAWYFDMYLLNVFSPLFTIGETQAYAFLVYMDYLHNISNSAIFLAEHKDGLTNKQFINEYIDKIKEFTDGIDERMVFEPMTDEQLMQANIDAMAADDADNVIKAQAREEVKKDDD